VKVVWTEQALLRLAEIEDYIWANNPAAAVAHTERLIDRAETLGENPRIGRVVPELPGGPLRELIDGKYRIVYRLRGEQVEIVTVFEGHRLFPTDDLPEQSEE
jgi:plasmid stabilization system protein ParE